MYRVLLLSTFFIGQVTAAPLHLDLEMSFDEYRAVLEKNPDKKAPPSIKETIAMGERLGKWIEKINERRAVALSLSSEHTRGTGIPIEHPSLLSEASVKKETDDVLSSMPEAMRQVILGFTPPSPDIPVDEETFLKHALLLARSYQSAARFKSNEAYRSFYIDEAARDVRGYHYLRQNQVGEKELSNVSLLNKKKLSDIKNALTQICMNSSTNKSRCEQGVNRAVEKNSLGDFYKKYIDGAQKNWDSFFKIPENARRSDLIWGEKASTIVFDNPKHQSFIPYIQENIEDEYQWKGWGLKLIFGDYSKGPQVIFKKGVTPHVLGLGSDEIYLDSNISLDEYDSKWAIRHEFGHILGLPDCYIEFYDVKLEAYVSYQLDTKDLMCSRAGNMNERIYLELKNAYEKN